MKTVQVVIGSTVANIIVVPDDAVETSDGVSWSSLALVNTAETRYLQRESGGIGWVLEGDALVDKTAGPEA